MMSRTGSKHGLTLIEVMFAVTILTVGIFGVIRAYLKSLDVFQIARAGIMEVSLAEMKLAEWRYRELAEGGLAPVQEEGSFSSPYERFNWEVHVYPSDVRGLNFIRIKCLNGREVRLNEFVLAGYAKNK